MFLTRMGMNTKMIVTGDMTQIDLPASQTSGLVQALRILKGVKGISFVELNKKDIVRHKLVERIVDAYEKFDKEAKAEREKRKNEQLVINGERPEESAEETCMTLSDVWQRLSILQRNITFSNGQLLQVH